MGLPSSVYRWSLVGQNANIVSWVVLGVSVAVVLALVPGAQRRHFYARGLPAALLGTLLLLAVARVTQSSWWQLPDPVRPRMYAQVGTAVLVALCVFARAFAAASGARARRREAGYRADVYGAAAPVDADATAPGRRGRTRGVARRAGLALALVVALGGGVLFATAQINRDFVAYPTFGALLGHRDYREISTSEATVRARDTFTGTPLTEKWRPSGPVPDTGAVATVDIPGTSSGLTMRDAKIYLPPAYFTEPRPLLPVLVLMAGQPGAPNDWYVGGRLTETMDAFQAAHGGLAPVVVVVDPTGSQWGNLLCVDSPLGKADTYLSRDVPAWISANLQVTDDHSRWGIGGLSLGGTCSLQLATAHPDVYGIFVNLSGQRDPTLGDHGDTVRRVYGGDEAAYQAASPINRLKKRRYPELSGVFVAGEGDGHFRPGLKELDAAARAAGVDSHVTLVPGGHDFGVWSAGLRTILPWFAHKTGITP